MATTAALAGFRVLDLTDDSGRLAGKVLAQLGADVVRLRRATPGAPMRSVPGGVLEWWFDAGTERVDIDLDDDAGRDAFLRLAARADVLIETARPGDLEARDLDVADLRRSNPNLVHVSLTPFGRSGPRAAWEASDLVIGALSGLLSVCGTPDLPLNGWGRQWFNVGGLYAAIAALVGLHAVRGGGAGIHFDLSLQHCTTSCSEHLLMYWLYMNQVPQRQGALHWTGLYDVLPCRDGDVMMTPTPSPENMLAWLLEDGMAGSLGESPPETVMHWAARAPEVMNVMRAWARTKEAESVFFEGQRRNLSFGLVRSISACATCPQHQARGFVQPLANSTVRSLNLPFRLGASAPVALGPPPAAAVDTADILARWAAREARTGDEPRSLRPLAGLRVLDFTWVLAGPMATRVFADLGAEVIKLQTEVRAQGAGHNEFPFFLMWNRNKLGASIDMKEPGALDVFRRLVQQADIVIDNFAPGVLERWGIGYEAVHAWNPRVIYLSMSGCGNDGPWRDFVTFAPTIQALSGLTYLTNPPTRRDVGFGVSLNDHVSGLFGAIALLAALETRRRTGEGQFIDLSQLEVGTYLVGPAMLDYLENGREAQPIGNADAFATLVPNSVHRCADGEWLALTARDDAEWQRLCVALDAADLAADVQLSKAAGRQTRAAEIQARLDAWASRQQAAAAMRHLQEAGIAAGMVQTAKHLTDDDEQLAWRGWLAEVDHATMGRQRHDCFPALIEGLRVETATAPPILGQHSFEIYRDLAGMSDEEIAAAIGAGLFV